MPNALKPGIEFKKLKMKILLFLLLPAFCSAQLVAKNRVIANLSSQGHGMVELQTNPDTHLLMIIFSNRKYDPLVDYKTIIFNTVDEYAAFVSHMKQVDKYHDYLGRNYKITYTPKNTYSGPELIISTSNDDGFYFMPISFIKKYETALTKTK